MSDDVGRLNRAFWNRDSDDYQARHGEDLSARAMAWGVWRIPEGELGVLGDVAGLDVLELGCGAAHWSLALTGAGARPVGLDLSERQLAHAREARERAGARLPLVQGDAARLPFAAASFDVVFGDHGAVGFADPRRTVPEVARVLRPGGLFAFCIPTPWLFVCWDLGRDRVSRRLHRGYFGLDREEAEGFVEFQLPYGAWIRLLRGCGLEVEDLIEIRPPEDAVTTYRDYAPLAWAREWPAEHIWKARKPRGPLGSPAV